MSDPVALGDAARDRVIAAARVAAQNAYAPYSRFAVGAAVLLSDGTITVGANFENASYGLSLCAETAALAAVSSAGRLRDVVAIGVVGGPAGGTGPQGLSPVHPCGRCRQIINEAAQLAGRDVTIWCSGGGGGPIAQYRLSDLLPHSFGPADLGITG